MFRTNLLICVILLSHTSHCHQSPASHFSLSGPGLEPDSHVLPCRYFFIKSDTKDVTVDTEDVKVSITGDDDSGGICRAHTELLQVSVNFYLVRYKVYYSCHNLKISVLIYGDHVTGSPRDVTRVTQPDTCNCPQSGLDQFIKSQCSNTNGLGQMEDDLSRWFVVFFYIERERETNQILFSISQLN